MAIMLTADEIPKFWEAIKFAVVNAEMIGEEYWERYFPKLLYGLLSGKIQCFVRLSDDRKLQMIGLTSIEIDRIRDIKTLFCYSLYSFAKASKDVWANDFGSLIRWAKANECKSIMTWSNNDKAINLLLSVGMNKRFDMFQLDLGGV